jgi:hypothetical protein
VSAFHSPPSCRVTTVPSTTVPYSSPGCLCRPVLTPGSHSVVISVKTLSGMPVTGASATSMLTLTCCASADADPRSKAMAHTVAKHRITASQSLLGRGNLRLSIGRPDYAHQSYTHLTRGAGRLRAARRAEPLCGRREPHRRRERAGAAAATVPPRNDKASVRPGNVQLLWTRQLPPAARSREHSVSAASRVSAAMLTRCQIAALPMVVRTMSGSRPPRIA